MLSLVIAVLGIAFFLYLWLFSDAASRSTQAVSSSCPMLSGLIIHAIHRQVEPPTREAKAIIRWLGLSSGLIVCYWIYSAIWTSLDNQQSLFTTLLRPFVQPVASSVLDVLVQVGMWLFDIFLVALAVLYFATVRAGRRIVTARIRISGRHQATRITRVVFMEKIPGEWPDEVYDQMKRGSIIVWQDTNIAIQGGSFTNPSACFGFTMDELLSQPTYSGGDFNA